MALIKFIGEAILIKTSRSILGALLALAIVPAGQASVPYPTADMPKAVDLGSTAAVEGSAPLSVSVALKLGDAAGAQALLESIMAPGSPAYHSFITPAQFRASFGPGDAAIGRVSAALRAYGLTVSRASTTLLRVSGTPAALESAFHVSLHTFRVPAYGANAGFTYHAPLSVPRAPEAAAAAVQGVLGLDTKPRYRPYLRQAQSHATLPAGTRAANPHGGITDPFEELTVADFASYYDVTPLYNLGVNGRGRTLGIVTLASMTPSDAFAYWSALGLKVDPNRLHIIDIDGGPGAPSDASGSLETTIDVQQSGGIAPGAHIVVYQAPNTNQAFADAFAAAIDADIAQSVSVSWGEWEWFDDYENAPVVNPFTGQVSSSLQAFDDMFLQAALQGQSFFAASGDNGAYDANDGTDSNGNPLVPPYYSLVLSVDNPASDPHITAAGGTTLPGEQEYLVNGSPFIIDLKEERVWGWDYLIGLCAALGYTPSGCGILYGGSGGGVSFYFARPSYQEDLAGVQSTQPHQAFVDLMTTPPEVYVVEPSFFPGRNVPDISFNADPQTGYEVYYTSSVTGFGIQYGWGGTSFVGPQLNGSTALFGEYVNSRIGLLNYSLYQLAKTGGYGGSAPPLRAITQGDNWFYRGSRGYNPAAGLGTLDVYNLANALRQLSGR